MKPKFIVGILAAIAVMTLTVKVTTERDGYLGDLFKSVDIFESFAPAPTTDTTVGRLELVHPDLGHDGGAVLHTKVRDAWTKISDNMNSRYQEYSGVADSAVTTYRHNFGVSFTEVTVLIYTGSGTNLTRVTTVGQAGDYQVAANGTNPKLDIDITAPTSGGPHTFAVIVIHGSAVEVLDNLNDVDVTTVAPEDGQALVYDSGGAEWVPGASGDASLKCQDVTDPNVTIKSGTMWIKNGQEVQVASDLVVSLDTILGSDPADDTTYYLNIYLDALSAPTTTATGRSVRVLDSASELALLTTIPENSQLSRYVPICKIHSADTGTVWSGTGADFETLSFRIFEGPNVNVSPTVYELSKQAVGSVGSSGQLQAGHVLTDDSFPSYTTELSYYNLGDVNDDSTNSRTLTNNGTIPFTGLDIFGVAGTADLDGTDDYFSSSDAFFDTTGDFLVSAWINLDDYNSGLNDLFSKWDTASKGWKIRIQGSFGLRIFTSTDGSAETSSTFADYNDLSGWHHFAFYYSATNQSIEGYLDGAHDVTHSVGGTIFNSTNDFYIGAENATPANFMDGRIDEFYYYSGSFTDAEIRRTYSAKIPHNQNVAVENQSWSGSFFNANDDYVGEFDQDWLVHKTPNAVFVDFGLPSTSKASLKMQNHSMTSTVVPVETYTTGKLSSAPSFPISHGLPCTPKDFYVLTEGQTTAADWDKRYDLLSADSTQILGDVSSLTIDGSHRLEIVASCAPVAVAVPSASTTEQGIVTTSTQSFAGDKTFTGQLIANGTDSQITVKGDETAGCTGGNVCSGDPSLTITSGTGFTGGTMLGGKFLRVGSVANFSFATTMNPSAARWDFSLDSFPFTLATGQGSCSGGGFAQTGSNHTVCTVVDLTSSTAKVWCDDTSDNANPANQTIYFTFQCELN